MTPGACRRAGVVAAALVTFAPCAWSAAAGPGGEAELRNPQRIAAHSASPDEASVARVAADGVLQRTNAFREQHGREPLKRSEALGAAASGFAHYMARTDRYGHEADGRNPSRRAKAAGYAYCVIEENIAYRFRSTGFDADELAQGFAEGWEHSPPHRKNLLAPSVVDTGIGIARSTQTGRWYGVQMFGLPESARITFRVTNRSGRDVGYRLGSQQFDLPPRVTRVHEMCRKAPLSVEWPGGQPAATVEPSAGQRYTVDRDAAGRWRLRSN